MHPVSGPQLNPSRKSPIENLVRKITTKITPRCKVPSEFLNLLRIVFILPLFSDHGNLCYLFPWNIRLAFLVMID